MTQTTMYEQITGDKFTTLTAAFVAGTDTTITVGDTSFLLSATNLAAIRQTDRSALVVIKYTGKTATTLTGVTVVEGDSTAALTATYPIGALLSRPLTKSDIDAIQGNIADHVGNTSNPHRTSKAQVGLSNTENGATLDPVYVDYYEESSPTCCPTSNEGDTCVAPDDDDNLKKWTCDNRHTWTPSDVTLNRVYIATKTQLAVVVGDTADDYYKIADAASVISIRQHVANRTNPHAVTKAQVGLPNVPDGAQINILEGVQLAGNDLTIVNKKVNITSVPKLTTARKIDGVSFDGTGNVNRFGTCSTAAATSAKTVSITGFSLTTGSLVVVKFTNGNIANNLTLNVTSTGAKAITHKGVAISPEKLAVGGIYAFIYDGTNYEFVGSLIEDNPNITIHGFIVDETNSDPQNCMTYVGASKALADYAARLAAYQTLCRHCVVKAAERQFYVDETNWAKKEDDTTDSGVANGTSLDGDFVMEYPSFWWRITPLGTDVHLVEFTWDNPGSSGDWIPCHMRNGTIRKAHWVGAFEGIVADGKLRSVYSTTTVPTVSMTNEAFHNAAKANGTAGGLTGDDNTYTISQPLVYIMRCILKYWLYKTLDLQTDVARGIVDDGSSVIGKRAVGYGMSLTGGYTQGTPASSQVYTDNVAAVAGGEINPYGDVWEHMIDFAYRFGEIAFAIDGADHFNITTLTTANWDELIPENWEKVKGVGTTSGYIRKMLWAAHFPFVSKDTSGGSSTTNWADYTYRNSGDNASNKVPRCCLAGASWSAGSRAGPACLALDGAVGISGGVVGARLQITSKN